MPESTDRLMTLTAGIVGSYLARHAIPVREIPDLMRTVRDGLVGLSAPRYDQVPAMPTEAQIRASVQHEHLVSFLDGRPYKTMKRHLTAHGLTPEGYRQRFGLPADYPMVAPAYAAERSRIAREIQLGVPGKRAQLQAAE
ncbi:MucR family transcriptional regulator [Methylobacterium brachiatum]|uniref:MucR family transcriptional regulator n=1 Tax=Methylobacterium brachiatum TaxID=269660 RepID=UPI00244A3E7B|nr:MucR family transcriptional regulator [Methylobacterium brachiatum]MDH2313354.1 MucR family transcriptional regulator [Methylobacterium brachiatum]